MKKKLGCNKMFEDFINSEFKAIKKKLKKASILGEKINLKNPREVVVAAYYLSEEQKKTENIYDCKKSLEG